MISGSTTRSHLALVLLVALAGGAPSAGAQQADTVRVGSETKRTTGTIVDMKAGDIACYLTLRDDRGTRFQEMADFEICEQRSLLNKRVSLAYALQKVMSPDCQGDPDCKKTRTVAIVRAARPAPQQAQAAAPASGETQASFCTSTETVVFSCRAGAKMVSVCASRDAGRGKGYLQYRFGKPGDPLELSLPESQVAPAKAATGNTEAFSGGGGAWLRFAKGAFTYTVYTGIGNWGPRGEKRTKEGLVVERGGKPVANLACTSKPVTLLGPDWFEKVGIGSGGQDFDFPE
ncbi:MAG: hypothetical protein ACOY4R_09265 [Pseudomonadota bacterium]